jgi:PAS domain S-box-containing protein
MTGDVHKTKEQLIRELVELRQRASELEAGKAERKRAEGALRENRNLLHAIIEGTPNPIFLKDLQGRYLMINTAGAQHVGIPAEEIIGKNDKELFSPEIASKFMEEDKNVITSGEARVVEEIVPLGAEERIYLSTKSPFRDIEGKTIGVIGVARDITERKQAEEALQRLSLQNELILNSAGDGIYGLDLEGRTTFCNPSAAQMIGWKVEDLIGKHQHDILHHSKPDGSPYPREECPIYAAFKDGAVHHVTDEVFWRKDGTSFPVEYISTPIRNDREELVGAVVTFQDITERKRAEEQLKKSYDELNLLHRAGRTITESMDMAEVLVFIVQQTPAFLGATQCYVLLLDEDRQELAGAAATEPYSAEFKKTRIRMDEPSAAVWALTHNQTFNSSRAREDRHLSRRLVEHYQVRSAVFLPLTVKDRPLGVLLYAHDEREGAFEHLDLQTLRRFADQTALAVANIRLFDQVKESRDYLETLIEQSTDAIIASDRDGKIILFNEGAEALSGYRRDEVIGRRGPVLYEREEDAKAVMRMMREGGGTVSAYETTLRAKDGTTIPALISASLLYDEDGREAGAVGISKDLRERKKVEEELRQAHEELWDTKKYLDSLIESSTDAVISTNQEGNVVFFSTGAERLLGYLRDEVIGQRVTLIYDNEERAKAVMRRMRQGGGTVSAFETILRAKDGSLIPVLISASILYTEDGQEAGTVGFSKDLRERKRAEEALKRFAHQQMAVASVGSAALRGGELQSLMDEAVRLTAEAMGTELCKVLKLDDSGDSLRLVAGVGWREGVVGAATVGTELDSQAGYTLSERGPIIVEDLRSETRFSGPPLLHDHGVVSGLSVPMVAGNLVFGVMGAHTTKRRGFSEDDIHFLEAMANVVTTAALRRQVEEELQRAQASVMAAEKLAALGRLTAGVSHEILNPLTVINLALHRMLIDTDIDPEMTDDLQGMKDNSDRITKIVLDLIDFARHRAPERDKIDLNEAVKRSLDLVEHDLKHKDITAELDLAEELPSVFADFDQLCQVVLNLLTNACHATPEGGRIVVGTNAAQEDGRRFVELRIEDSGDGVPPDAMDKLFDPFFTTKVEGEGTGLGLSICKGIVDAHRGTIRADSGPRGGAVFIVQLPLEGEGENVKESISR